MKVLPCGAHNTNLTQNCQILSSVCLSMMDVHNIWVSDQTWHHGFRHRLHRCVTITKYHGLLALYNVICINLYSIFYVFLSGATIFMFFFFICIFTNASAPAGLFPKHPARDSPLRDFDFRPRLPHHWVRGTPNNSRRDRNLRVFCFKCGDQNTVVCHTWLTFTS